MRAFLRSAFLDVLGSIRSPKNGIHILNGHYLSRSVHDDPKVFERLLGGLRAFSEFIRIEDAVHLVASGECEKFNGVGVAFTFDDGFLDCYTALAPALNKYDTNACFFVNPGFVDGDSLYRDNFTDNVVLTSMKLPMTWAQIKELHGSGFIIGNHTMDHRRLNSGDSECLFQQIVGGRDVIAKKINGVVDYFAWPYGQAEDINEAALEIACDSHRYVFSGCGYRDYCSSNGKVLNRRHFEADWKLSHMRYFLSFKRNFSQIY